MTYKEEFITFMVRSRRAHLRGLHHQIRPQDPLFCQYRKLQDRCPGGQAGGLLRCLYPGAHARRHYLPVRTGLQGHPLAVSAAASLYRNYDRDLPYCFNRKEAKDHGEGGSMVGYKPQDGDDVAIVEDVVTAGTAVRESIELFKHVADVNIKALFVSVDRMERGTRECSTLDELRQDYGIQVFPIVTVREVIAFLHNNSIDGKVYIDDEMKAKMEAYLEEYGAKG